MEYIDNDIENSISGNIFIRELDDYKCDINPIKEYIKEASVFVAKNNSITVDEAKPLVLEAIKKSNKKDPIVTYRAQKDNGDREETSCTLSTYLKDVIRNNQLIAPSFTTYKHPHEQKSLHSDFMAVGTSERKKHKKLAFKYEMEGNTYKYNFHNTNQKTMKVNNNSLSGAYGSKSTILYNASAHYTLTSITRCVASIGNAFTESMVAGNMIFLNPENVINYITAIVTNIDYKLVNYCVNKYKLVIPTVDDIMLMVDKSSKYYWIDKEYREHIVNYLSKLNDLERVAVLYVNNMYNMRLLNEQLFKDMMFNISQPVDNSSDNPAKDYGSAEEYFTILASFIWSDIIRGTKLVVSELEASESGRDILMKLASTVNNIKKWFSYYRMLIRTFFTTDILPIDIANVKEMQRDVIVLSDTDSTCGSYEEWANWYYGKSSDYKNTSAVPAVVMTIVVQTMDHYIKVFAKNMNIPNENVNYLAMKNEFYWPVFIPANVNKHYFADVMIQEGNVYKENKDEVKGVHLIASTIDQYYASMANKMMREIFERVKSGKNVSTYEFLVRIANIEREIISKIKRADLTVFKANKIKGKNSYKLEPERSPYLHHTLWMDVFAEKYGSPGEPSYSVIKVPSILDSKKAMSSFIDGIEDESIKEKFKVFIEKYNKENIGTFMLPVSIVANKGIPEELSKAIDIERVVLDNCGVFYTILETIGGYRKPNRLISQMGY